MGKHKEQVPRMKDTSELERELRAIESSSFESGTMLKRMMEVIKADREAILFEVGTFVLSPRDSSYSSQVNYIQGMRTRIKS
jgi:hypothetical protein